MIYVNILGMFSLGISIGWCNKVRGPAGILVEIQPTDVWVQRAQIFIQKRLK